MAAAVLDPREQFVGSEAKGYRREEIERPRLLFEVSFGRVIHVGDTGPYRVEGFERAHKRAGRKHLDLDAPAGRGADRLRETNSAGLKAG